MRVFISSHALSRGMTLLRFGEARETPALRSLRLDALDDPGKPRAVFVPDRLHGVLERFLIGDIEDLDAGGGDLTHRLLFVGLPQHALFALGLARELADEFLVVPCEPVPGSSRE